MCLKETMAKETKDMPFVMERKPVLDEQAAKVLWTSMTPIQIQIQRLTRLPQIKDAVVLENFYVFLDDSTRYYIDMVLATSLHAPVCQG